MDKIFFTGRVKEINADDRTLTAYASTGDIDRDNEVIEPEAWRKTIEEFKSVPLLWAHVYNAPPIGRAGGFAIDNKGLKFSAKFANTSFADEIWKLYSDGFLDSFSVGFTPTEWEDNKEESPRRTFTEAELLEISAVPIPANPHATVERDAMIPVIGWKSISSLSDEQKEYNEDNLETENPDIEKDPDPDPEDEPNTDDPPHDESEDLTDQEMDELQEQLDNILEVLP